MDSTQEQRKLTYWLIQDYANFKHGKNVGSKCNEFEIEDAKDELKNLYLQKINYKYNHKAPEEFMKFIDTLSVMNDDNKYDLKLKYIKSIQDFAISMGNFSLSMAIMTKKGYSKFINFLFDFMNYNQIPFRKQIAELMLDQDENHYIYTCLKYKVCNICGNHNAEFHHVEQVGSKGYKSDYGQLTYCSLCTKCHSENHSDGRFNNKVKGIKLNDKQLEVLKGVYKNHFKGEKK